MFFRRRISIKNYFSTKQKFQSFRKRSKIAAYLPRCPSFGYFTQTSIMMSLAVWRVKENEDLLMIRQLGSESSSIGSKILSLNFRHNFTIAKSLTKVCSSYSVKILNRGLECLTNETDKALIRSKIDESNHVKYLWNAERHWIEMEHYKVKIRWDEVYPDGKKYRNNEFSFEELRAQKYYAESRKKDLAKRLVESETNEVWGRLFFITI